MEPEIDYSIVDHITYTGGIPMMIAAVINCNLCDVRYPDYTSTVDEWATKVMSAISDDLDIDIDAIKQIIENLCERTLGTFVNGGCIHGCELCGPRYQSIRVICTNESDEWFDEVIYCGIQ